MKAKYLKGVYLLAVAAISLVLSSCGGQNNPDPRDAFVGTYSYEASGNIDFDFSITTYHIPLNDKGKITISKVGDENKVLIEGWNNPINATIAGNQLILESNEYTTNYGDIALQLSFTYHKATLVENKLTWDTDVRGEGRYSSFSAIGAGTISVVATKE